MSDTGPRRSRRISDSQTIDTDSTPNVSDHKSETPIDARTLQLRHLRDILSNQQQNKLILHDLDFVDLADEKIIELFYNPKRHRDRSLDANNNIILPPHAYRRSHADIISFFNLGTQQKKDKIIELKDWTIDRSRVINYTESRYCVSLQENEEPPSTASTKLSNQPDILSSDEEIPVTSPVSASVCGGIHLEYLKSLRWTAEKFEEKTFGFADTYRESLMNRVRLENPRNPFGNWNYSPSIVGVL